MEKKLDKVTIEFDDKLVQIYNDKELRNFLKKQGNQALKLADYARKEYEAAMGKTLEISRDSLAIEILGHVYADDISGGLGAVLKLSKSPVVVSLTACLNKIKEHTEIIDCGEKSIDGNRHIWDSLVEWKTVIYKLCGQ